MADLTGPVPESLPPPQEEGESAEAYVERLEWYRSRVPADVLYTPIRGFVAGSDGIKPWTKADYVGRSGSGELMRENPRVFTEQTVAPFDPLPPIRRRTPGERMDEIRNGLTALAIQSYADGAMRLPRSVCEKLVCLGVYKRLEDAQSDTVEQTCRKFDVYAEALLRENAPNRERIPEVA